MLTPLEPGQHLNQQAAVLLTASYLDPFLFQTKNNATLKQLVKGVLVRPTGMPPFVQVSELRSSVVEADT